MSFDIERVAQEARAQIKESLDSPALEAAKIRYLGRKGLLSDLMAQIPSLPLEERKSFGAAVNALKNELGLAIEQKKQEILDGSIAGESDFDVTLPGLRPLLGRSHPLTKIQDEIIRIFSELGFKVFEGPEIETEFNNFEALNIPLDHPSRDAFDTFYIQPRSEGKASCCGSSSLDRRLLRSHTSPAQIRAMKICKPPMAVIVPGRVYRPDAVDASHSFMFHQIEGFVLDTGVRFSDLKGVLVAFAREMFGSGARMRFRPSFFPFTEPSAEVDVSCFLCQAKGCSVCKRSGWLEILGCGMIHPHVLRSAGQDPRRWGGFAFGMGIERIAMLRYGINDIRAFFDNHEQFLNQF